MWGFIQSTMSIFPVSSKFKLLQREWPSWLAIWKEIFHHLLLNQTATQSRKVIIIKTIKRPLIENGDQISRLKFKSMLHLKNSLKSISVQLLEVKGVKWGVEKWLPGPNLCGLMFLRKHYCCLWLKWSYENNYFDSLVAWFGDPSDSVGNVCRFLIASTNQIDIFKITNTLDVAECVLLSECVLLATCVRHTSTWQYWVGQVG